MGDDLIGELAGKCLLCHNVDLLGTEAMTQEVIEEEVVQLVRAHEVLSLLLNVAILVSRQQFRTNRCVDDVT